MVQLLIIRHGEAEFGFKADSERELTDVGRRQVLNSIETRMAGQCSVDCLITSPLVRARQSGALIQQSLPCTDSLVVDWLTPSSVAGPSIKQLYHLQATHQWEAIVLVTHLPFVAEFIEVLCGMPRGSVVMNTGSLVSVETDVIAAGCAQFNWQHHPKLQLA